MKAQIISQPPPGYSIHRADASVVTVNMTGGGSNLYLCPPSVPQAITSEAVMNATPVNKILSVSDTYPVPDKQTGVSVSANNDNVYLPQLIARSNA